MSELQYVNEDDFQSEVLESSQPVLVDFTAVWCGPCKTLEPIVIELADEWSDKVKGSQVGCGYQRQYRHAISSDGRTYINAFQ